jgi:alkylhydroperoxidase/carboxymuconolactone decarboxylase family protein YurZ
MLDMRNLTRLTKLDENAPEPMKAFWAFDKEAFKDGAIDVLHKQLMAVASVVTLKPATWGHVKTGHFGWPETRLFYRSAGCICKLRFPM